MHHETARPVPGWAVVAFLVLAMGGAWLVALPLWTSGQGLAFPFTGLLLPAMMATPAVAAVLVLVVLRLRHQVPRPVLRFLGVWPLRPAKRTVWVTVAAYVGGLLLPVAALAVAVLSGWFRLDLTGFSGFRAVLRSAGVADLPIPVETLVVIQLVQLPFVALLNVFVTIGEELGWRGFLVPALARFGAWPAVLVSGAVWGLWHAPVILLGYDFGRTDWLGVVVMVVGCTLLGVVFGWLRLRTGSVWPAVFAHAGVNGAAGIGSLLGVTGDTVTDTFRNPLGVSGWVVLGVVVLVLVCTRALGRRGDLAPPGVASTP